MINEIMDRKSWSLELKRKKVSPHLFPRKEGWGKLHIT